MSQSYGLTIRRKVRKEPQRPLGVTILATFGILIGLVLAIAALAGAFMLALQGASFYTLTINLSVGLGLALLIIWVNWGLMDLMGWAWWLYLLLGLTGMVLSIVTIASAAQLAPLVAPFIPFPVNNPRMLSNYLIGEAIIVLAMATSVSIYLISENEPFGVFPKRRRPPWER